MPASPEPRPAAAQHPQLQFARVASGARIAWARGGHGPALVRVAHWLTHVEREQHSPIWAPWLQRLGSEFAFIRYDERGCGLSGTDDVAPGLDCAVEELEAVVQASGEPRVALLGASGAAAVAIAFAVRHPERVSRLVLLGGYLCGMLGRSPSAATLAWFEAQVRLVELGWGRNHPAVQQFFSSTFVPDASAQELQALNELQRLSCDGARAASFMRSRAAFNVCDLAPRVACPTLVLHAAGDLVVAHDSGRELASAIPGASFETLATRNHIPTPSDPAFDRCCEAVIEFVRERPDAPGLTPRERELAELVAQGLDNLQIAARMGVAHKTVRNALSALYAKLQVEGRPQAVVRTRELGLGPAD